MMSVFAVIGITVYVKYFNRESTLPLFPYLFFSVSGIWLGGTMALQLAEYRMLKSSKAFFKLSVSSSIVTSAVIFLLIVVFKLGAFGSLFGNAFATFLICIVCLVMNWKCLQQPFNWSTFRDILIFCWPIALAGVLEFFTGGFGRLFLERIGNNVEFGYYIDTNIVKMLISRFLLEFL